MNVKLIRSRYADDFEDSLNLFCQRGYRIIQVGYVPSHIDESTRGNLFIKTHAGIWWAVMEKDEKEANKDET